MIRARLEDVLVPDIGWTISSVLQLVEFGGEYTCVFSVLSIRRPPRYLEYLLYCTVPQRKPFEV